MLWDKNVCKTCDLVTFKVLDIGLRVIHVSYLSNLVIDLIIDPNSCFVHLILRDLHNNCAIN